MFKTGKHRLTCMNDIPRLIQAQSWFYLIVTQHCLPSREMQVNIDSYECDLDVNKPILHWFLVHKTETSGSLNDWLEARERGDEKGSARFELEL